MSSGVEDVEAVRGRRLFEWIVFLVYIGFTAFVAYHHEPWRDEADPWLYVRDADYPTILARTRYAGFPALWFLLLSPLAKLGAPYWSQKILNLAIASGAAAVILWRAPFSRTTRALLVLSYFLVFEYAVVVRSYTLSTLLLVGLAALYGRRFERPLSYAAIVFLLANTSSHALIIAAAAGALYLWDLLREPTFRTRRNWTALAGMVIGGLAAIVQLRRPPDGQLSGMVNMVRPVSLAEMLGWPFIPSAPLMLAAPFGALILVVATAAIWKRSRVHVAFFWGSAFLFAWLFTFVYVSGVRHYGFILLLLLVTLWMTHSSERSRARSTTYLLLNVALAFAVLIGFRSAFFEWRWAYSGSAEAARFLLEKHLEDVPIAAHQAPNTAAVLPFLGDHRKLWFAATEEYGSYMKYDRAFDAGLYLTFGEAEARIRKAFPRGGYLLLANNFMFYPGRHGYRLVFSNQDRVWAHPEERFYIYEPVPAANSPE